MTNSMLIFHLFDAVEEIRTYAFQVDRNDGSCFLKSCVALRLVHDSGAHRFVPFAQLQKNYFVEHNFVHRLSFILQNDLIHAWGLDMQLGYCSQASHIHMLLMSYFISTNKPLFSSIHDWENFWHCLCTMNRVIEQKMSVSWMLNISSTTTVPLLEA